MSKITSEGKNLFWQIVDSGGEMLVNEQEVRLSRDIRELIKNGAVEVSADAVFPTLWLRLKLSKEEITLLTKMIIDGRVAVSELRRSGVKLSRLRWMMSSIGVIKIVRGGDCAYLMSNNNKE